MNSIRTSIEEDSFVDFVKDFFQLHYPKSNYPPWIVDSLKAVNIIL